jgi:hypothetical protein
MPTPQDPANITAAEKKELLEWKRKAAKASGEIWLALDDNQKVHVSDVKSDPAGMWKKLEAVHVQKKPSSRFIAYDSLFNIRKEETETLSALMARTDLLVVGHCYAWQVRVLWSVNTSRILHVKIIVSLSAMNYVLI